VCVCMTACLPTVCACVCARSCSVHVRVHVLASHKGEGHTARESRNSQLWRVGRRGTREEVGLCLRCCFASGAGVVFSNGNIPLTALLLATNFCSHSGLSSSRTYSRSYSEAHVLSRPMLSRAEGTHQADPAHLFPA